VTETVSVTPAEFRSLRRSFGHSRGASRGESKIAPKGATPGKTPKSVKEPVSVTPAAVSVTPAEGLGGLGSTAGRYVGRGRLAGMPRGGSQRKARRGVFGRFSEGLAESFVAYLAGVLAVYFFGGDGGMGATLKLGFLTFYIPRPNPQ
jgi:hypothetical protein